MNKKSITPKTLATYLSALCFSGGLSARNLPDQDSLRKNLTTLENMIETETTPLSISNFLTDQVGFNLANNDDKEMLLDIINQVKYEDLSDELTDDEVMDILKNNILNGNDKVIGHLFATIARLDDFAP